MTSLETRTTEETLDPQDWEGMRALAHRMVDDMVNYVRDVRERPVWQPIPDDVKKHFETPLPLEPQAPEEIYQDIRDHVLEYPTGNIHPRFWGWVLGAGTFTGALADLVAGVMNPNLGGAEHSANYVEKQVIEWCKAMLAYPPESSGLLVSGGSMANLVGINVARNVKAGIDVRKHGVQGIPQRLRLYCSTETHSSVQRALEALGLGSESLCYIPVNSEYQIDLEALEAAIAADRAAGHLPFCVVGTAGTTNTGAYDDLNRLADICQRENLWFHVDGAVGAVTVLAPELRYLTAGIERADSVAFDMHKWLSIPYEVGCVLVRSAEEHRHTFTLTPDYLTHAKRGLAAGELWFSDYGIQLSRGFRALKVWVALKEYGAHKYGRLIQQHIEQARYLADLVEHAPELELLAPVPSNIVNFRFTAPGLDDTALDRLNEELLIRLQEAGIAAPSGTMIQGKYAIRVCAVNHRSRREDFDLLVREVIRLGKELLAAQD